MSRSREVFLQSNGEVTRAYYADLCALGPIGAIAMNLFRAQKTSTRAKRYRGRKYKGAAYDVKGYSLSELSAILIAHGEALSIQWGWKEDPKTVFGSEASWVLYVDLPQGQVSFHSPSRGVGREYHGDWDRSHASEERILAFCDEIMGLPVNVSPVEKENAVSVVPEQPREALAASPATKLVFGDPASILMKRARV